MDGQEGRASGGALPVHHSPPLSPLLTHSTGSRWEGMEGGSSSSIAQHIHHHHPHPRSPFTHQGTEEIEMQLKMTVYSMICRCVGALILVHNQTRSPFQSESHTECHPCLEASREAHQLAYFYFYRCKIFSQITFLNIDKCVCVADVALLVHTLASSQERYDHTVHWMLNGDISSG